MGKIISRAGALSLLVFVLFNATQLQAQAGGQTTLSKAASSLNLREIGPAVMGGRIADIEVNPVRSSTWYVAAGSGGLWKTTNAGISWTPIFDEQPSYSIGDVALDPSNPEVVWVGTGENVSGRHVAWGSGVYRSRNGGGSWENVGLEKSEHIGKIIVDPRDGNVVFVAAEGPLWNEGGERGLFRSLDGGESWVAVLEIDENTGVTDVEFDPSNPDVIYAAAFQRQRRIWGYMAGGPGSGIYKSTDGGDSWRKLEAGLPGGDLGKIGLAVTPADPDLVYATIEARGGGEGFYRSTDKGEGWERRNGYISGGTGPHYYQEIEASPADPNLVYQMDVFVQVTRDGGATFDNLGTGREAHSDNHALWIDPDDWEHLLVGTDAGLYESFDEGLTWRHFPNLPVSQFYKVAMGNAEPFYNIIGGAQDLGTLYGPSRTMNAEGVRNEDWYVPMGSDGYNVGIDPTDPNILYLETQEGNLYRTDRRSEEALGIQPQPAPGDPPERWNWDAPILISPHAANRLYFGSQRVWKSENRGNSWTPISGDLTRNLNRYEMEFMGRVWSVDDLHDNGAMSQYATITTITESPLVEGVLYAGTDDGNIQVTGGWGGELDPGRGPSGGAGILLHQRHGGFPPRRQRSLRGGRRPQDWGLLPLCLPERRPGPELAVHPGRPPRRGPSSGPSSRTTRTRTSSSWGTEYGIYFTANGGTNWHMLRGGVPTIAFRDIKIHRRDEDLVGATFGRGFYILDDYTPLRGNGFGSAGWGRGSLPCPGRLVVHPFSSGTSPGQAHLW